MALLQKNNSVMKKTKLRRKKILAGLNCKFQLNSLCKYQEARAHRSRAIAASENISALYLQFNIILDLSLNKFIIINKPQLN